jgi:predicted dinucleotide-binding enzyme
MMTVSQSASYQTVGSHLLAFQVSETERRRSIVNIGILGTGNLAVTLGAAWATARHSLLVTGRSPEKARRAAGQIGPAGQALEPHEFPGRADAIVVAVSWDGLEPALALVVAGDGSLGGKTVIDCTNPVDYATGNLLPESGSAAELVSRAAPGAHVVKALHLFAGASWPYVGEHGMAPVVAICGDDQAALDQTRSLIADLGGQTVEIGGLASARQLEDAAGFVDPGQLQSARISITQPGQG